MKIRINAISSEGIEAYRILRLMPDDSRVSIPACDWQESNVFEGMHNGGGYVLQVRDVAGNIAEQIVPIEEPLEIIAYGAFIYGGQIGITCAINIPAEMRYWWDISVVGEEYDAPLMTELNDAGWNGSFIYGHTEYLPKYYIGALHHYWIRVRSTYGQVGNVNGRYVITPEALDPIKPRWYVNTDMQKISIGKTLISGFAGMNSAFQHDVSTDSEKPSMDVGDSISKIAMDKSISLSIASVSAKLTYTVS
jgi:hypothetical protein